VTAQSSVTILSRFRRDLSLMRAVDVQFAPLLLVRHGLNQKFSCMHERKSFIAYHICYHIFSHFEMPPPYWP
jgi:hypothetical protein